MDDKLRNKLKQMVKEYDSEETTGSIRKEKNSKKIHQDVQTMLNLKTKYHRLRKSNPSQFKQMVINKCNFLYTNFTNVFHKLFKDEF